MTWEVEELGKHFIATIINGYDLVPTFSTDFVLPTPISQNPPSMPNVLASMNKEGNTKASKITGIDSMLPLPLIPLDNCLTVVEVVRVLDGGLKENITSLQEGVSKGGFLHHDVHENQHNQLIHQGKVSGQGHSKENDLQGNLNTSHNTQKKNQKKECSLERIGTKHTRLGAQTKGKLSTTNLRVT
ncbi:hypothetical protein KY290_021381 [Solanum tuberosum]|uniref:Uncharacterized protein n=1 Tax=Solanum tuberosum TaxID=4113 RepID=A0ABQ7V2D1_SOLTU|nr:hypothetical protein KY289_020547 [Solanum tuberosum]KAH0693211.1 hypothetical protein KY285_020308 [Solanum tuberosum]KAH0757888.1 hypothetical protein KY290_021381 [Solanum tuberosum]